MNRRIFPIVLSLLFLGGVLNLFAQGTAFSYQGRLNDAGAPANGSYSLRFAVYDAVTNGNRVSLWLTNSPVAVSNGLFSTTLNFGNSLFTGTNYWLDIAVGPSNTTTFTTLFPRQPILPVPYAIFATTASNVLGAVSATQLTGTVPSAQISGTYGNAVNFTSGGNTFAGTFSGDGASLSNLNASQLTAGTVADTRLTANVALLDHNQTFTGANTFGNWGNAFTGSFFGNGLVGWLVTNSLSFQAVRDHGYVPTNAGMATILLPATSSLTNGDIVRISGAGTGGWLATENAGQSIIGYFSCYRNCILAPLPVNDDCSGVASSADGTVMYYAAGGVSGGVSVSTDSGQTWNLAGTPNLSGSYSSVACSANGRIVYAEPTSGTIQKSTNSGATWFSTGITQTGKFLSCTADGNVLFASNYACSGNGTNLAKLASGLVTVSTNGGSTFAISITTPVAFNCLAASSDCTKLVGGSANGFLYASSNRGATWTALTSSAQVWSGAWMSPDGSKFAATVSTSGSVTGGIYFGNVVPLPDTFSTNSIGGSRGSAVELQYIGNGQFMPVSTSGTLWAN